MGSNHRLGHAGSWGLVTGARRWRLRCRLFHRRHVLFDAQGEIEQLLNRHRCTGYESKGTDHASILAGAPPPTRRGSGSATVHRRQ